ncbi:MAG TPA: hypothetical protein VFO65_09980, partial [Acidimicrobiales bacterium]|nr:hypothetical protein [Acidimicrobiales bacterium]
MTEGSRPGGEAPGGAGEGAGAAPPGDAAGEGSRVGGRVHLLMAAMGVLAGLATAAVVPALRAGEVPVLWSIALVGALYTLGDLCVVTIRFGHNHHAFTWAETAVVVGLVLLPEPWLPVVATVASLVVDRVARRPALKTTFNATVVATATFLAQTVFGLAGGSHGVTGPRQWAALVAASFAFFLWTGVTVAAAVALSQGLRLRDVYLKGLHLNTLVWAGNTAVGILLVVMARYRGVLVVFPVLVAMLYVVYRSYLRAMHERDTWQVLQSASRDLLATEARDVATVVLDRTPDLFQAEFVELLVLDDERGAHASLFRWSGGADRTELRGQPDELAGAFWPRVSSEQETFQLVAERSP